MVFSKKELEESSAKGLKSHGKFHKPLNEIRLLFVKRKHHLLITREFSIDIGDMAVLLYNDNA